MWQSVQVKHSLCQGSSRYTTPLAIITCEGVIFGKSITARCTRVHSPRNIWYIWWQILPHNIHYNKCPPLSVWNFSYQLVWDTFCKQNTHHAIVCFCTPIYVDLWNWNKMWGGRLFESLESLTSTKHLATFVTTRGKHFIVTFSTIDSFRFSSKRFVNQAGFTFTAAETIFMPVAFFERKILPERLLVRKKKLKVRLLPLNWCLLAFGIHHKHWQIVARNTWHSRVSPLSPDTVSQPDFDHNANNWNVPYANAGRVLLEMNSIK